MSRTIKPKLKLFATRQEFRRAYSKWWYRRHRRSCRAYARDYMRDYRHQHGNRIRANNQESRAARKKANPGLWNLRCNAKYRYGTETISRLTTRQLDALFYVRLFKLKECRVLSEGETKEAIARYRHDSIGAAILLFAIKSQAINRFNV